ncbi:hypothetical protein BRC83_01185 [Halobacteriales archaeon QS_1_68_17]|nr:MAG: hypothetical protein BRC83_01185 [Halobacteriales archaeon QS_1_68_17]
MVNDIAIVYYGGGTLLFFFWAYGIYAFVRDLKNRFIPAFRQYRRGRKRLEEEKREEEEREEKEKQLL